MVLAILVFWAGTTTWMFCREVLPMLRSGEPPPFTIDLTDEVSLADERGFENRASPFGARAIAWTLKLQGEDVGDAITRVLRYSDRTYELHEELRSKKLNDLIPGWKIDRLSFSYRITKAGELCSLSVKAVVSERVPMALREVTKTQKEVGFEGDVKDGLLTLQAMLYEPDRKARGRYETYIKRDLGFSLQPIPVPPRGAVLNTLQPVNRLVGLREGQTWRVPRMEPLEIVLYALKLGDAPGTRYLDAEVSADELHWNGEAVPCWRIDYVEPGRSKVSARTWVKQSDGLVLQQEARHANLVFVMRRK
jgi:hypothetical protein